MNLKFSRFAVNFLQLVLFYRKFLSTRSVQKIRGLFELRGSSWLQENPLGVARFVQIKTY